MRKINKPILCVGEVITDIIIDTRKKLSIQQSTERLLDEDEFTEAQGSAAELSGGGTVGNVAISLSRLGEKTLFMGKIGNDSFGQFAKKNLENEEVDTRWLVTDNNKNTLVVICYTDENGDRDGFIYPQTGSASASVTFDDITPDVFSNIGLIFTSGISLVEEPISSTVLKLMRECRKREIPVAFDINLRTNVYGWNKKMKEIFLEAIELSDIILGSEKDEFAIISETGLASQIIKELAGKGKIIVSKAGSEGAAIYSKTAEYNMPAFSVNVVDTVGAGDIFNGGFLAAYVQGKKIKECLLWGSAAAAYSLQFAGAGNAPNNKQLQEFLSQNNSMVEKIS